VRTIVTTFLILLLTKSTVAVTQVSNLSESLCCSSSLTLSPENGIIAGGFTTDGMSYALQNAVMRLQRFNADPVTFKGRIHMDNAGQPGAVLEVLTGSTTITAPADKVDVVFSSIGTILQPNTTYWFSVVNSSGLGRADLTVSNGQTSPGGWTIVDTHVFSFDGGATWPSFIHEPLFSIDAVKVIPEPTTAVLGLLGVAGLMVRRRRAA